MENLENQVRSSAVTDDDSRDETTSGETSVRVDPASSSSLGLQVETTFCPTDVEDPFDTVEWELRSAAIKGEKGEVVFEQTDCEIPSSWSQLATNVVVSKYFFGEMGTSERENSVRQLIHRVTRTIADWGMEDGYFATEEDGERFYRELTWLCLHQHASFNSPVWFNVGLYHQYGVRGDMCNWHWSEDQGDAIQPENPYEYPQGSACFIQSVQDNMEDIMELARSEAMLFKFGSGTGTDLSTLRSHREKTLRWREALGPLVVHACLRPDCRRGQERRQDPPSGQDAIAQGLASRHRVDFIDCKQKEEEKARILLAKGYNYDDAYSSVLFQNANLSVRLTDDFMEAVEADKPWTTRWVTDEKGEGPTFQAKEVMDKMSNGAWACGDPGVQYDTTINRWHTCPNSGRINASNPCSEYMFLDDSACNLASINLMKFRQEDGTFDVDRFQAACRLVSSSPRRSWSTTPAIRPSESPANSHRFRPLGLGYSNLGSLLMSNGLPYDSDGSTRRLRRDHRPAARNGQPHQ